MISAAFTKHGSFCEILVFVLLLYAFKNIEELFSFKLKQIRILSYHFNKLNLLIINIY